MGFYPSIINRNQDPPHPHLTAKLLNHGLTPPVPLLPFHFFWKFSLENNFLYVLCYPDVSCYYWLLIIVSRNNQLRSIFHSLADSIGVYGHYHISAAWGPQVNQYHYQFRAAAYMHLMVNIRNPWRVIQWNRTNCTCKLHVTISISE